MKLLIGVRGGELDAPMVERVLGTVEDTPAGLRYDGPDPAGVARLRQLVEQMRTSLPEIGFHLSDADLLRSLPWRLNSGYTWVRDLTPDDGKDAEQRSRMGGARADGGMTLYSAGQPRDSRGRWTSTGDGAVEARTGEGHTLRVEREGAGAKGYHLTHRGATGETIHEEHGATLAKANAYAKGEGVAEKLTTAHFKATGKAQRPDLEPHIQRATADDYANPVHAWERLGGAEGLRRILPYEPTGILGDMLRHPEMPPGAEPRGRSREAMARAIIQRLQAHFGGGEAGGAAGRGAHARAAVDEAHAALARAVAAGDRAAVLEAARALVEADKPAGREAAKAGASTAKAAKANPFSALKPIGPIDLKALRPHGPMDPYALHTAYGHAQTRTFLSHLGIEELRRSAAVVQERTGHAPTNRASKGALVDFIMGHLPAEPA